MTTPTPRKTVVPLDLCPPETCRLCHNAEDEFEAVSESRLRDDVPESAGDDSVYRAHYRCKHGHAWSYTWTADWY